MYDLDNYPRTLHNTCIFTSCTLHILYAVFARAKKDDLEKEVLRHILKSSRRLESASIKQEAYIMGMSDSNDIDLDKYVRKVRAEIAAEDDNEENEGIIYSSILNC